MFVLSKCYRNYRYVNAYANTMDTKLKYDTELGGELQNTISLGLNHHVRELQANY